MKMLTMIFPKLPALVVGRRLLIVEQEKALPRARTPSALSQESEAAADAFPQAVATHGELPRCFLQWYCSSSSSGAVSAHVQ